MRHSLVPSPSGGAFVRIGVNQDGPVHISALSEKFVKAPREVVKAGQLVKVKVLEVVAPKRQRIALTLHMSDVPAQRSGMGAAGSAGGAGTFGRRDAARGAPGSNAGGMRSGSRMDRCSAGRPPMNSAPPANNAMAASLAKLKGG